MTEQEHWEERYTGAEVPPWDTGRPSLELARRLAEFTIAPCRAADIGCGTGTNAIWLAQRGFDATGVDISPTAIARAQARAAAAGLQVRFLAADITNLPDLGAAVSFFFDRGCYHAVRRVAADGYMRTLARMTAVGAMGVVLTGNAKEERKPGPPVVTEEIIRREWGGAFEILSLEEFRFDQDEADGYRHLGWSCVLRKR